MRRKLPTLTLVAGVAALSIVLVALLYREDFTRWYYLWRLRSSPEVLGEYLEEPDGSAARAASAEFLKTPEGRTALVDLFLSHLVPVFDRMNVHRVKLSESREIGRLLIVLGESNLWLGTSTVAGRMGQEWDNPDAVHSVFPEAHYRAFRELSAFPQERIAWPGRSHLALLFVSWNRFRELIRGKAAKEERALLPLDEISMDRPEPNDPVCVISPRGRECVPTLLAGLKLSLRMSRYRAALILGDRGPDAAEAVPELKRLAAETDDHQFRALLRGAIEKIEGHDATKQRGP